MTEQELQLAAILHVVHDYANLISAGTEISKCPPPPLNTHVQHAFLLNCRKLFEFFTKPTPTNPKYDDIRAEHFLSKKLDFELPTWNLWGAPMDKQMAHLTYSRVTNPVPWYGYKENGMFLDEFRTAWRKLRNELPEPYKTEFVNQVFLRKQPHPNGQLSEFRDLDLD